MLEALFWASLASCNVLRGRKQTPAAGIQDKFISYLELEIHILKGLFPKKICEIMVKYS